MTDDDPLSREEMYELFGESMPIEAVHLMWGLMTARELRQRLREMAMERARHFAGWML